MTGKHYTQINPLLTRVLPGQTVLVTSLPVRTGRTQTMGRRSTVRTIDTRGISGGYGHHEPRAELARDSEQRRKRGGSRGERAGGLQREEEEAQVRG